MSADSYGYMGEPIDPLSALLISIALAAGVVILAITIFGMIPKPY